MEQAKKWCAWMLGVPLWAAQAGADELWLLELERDDGIHLQFQGIEVERGSAPVWRQGEIWQQPLKPGDQLSLLVADGVATRIELLTANISGGSLGSGSGQRIACNPSMVSSSCWPLWALCHSIRRCAGLTARPPICMKGVRWC